MLTIMQCYCGEETIPEIMKNVGEKFNDVTFFQAKLLKSCNCATIDFTNVDINGTHDQKNICLNARKALESLKEIIVNRYSEYQNRIKHLTDIT
jgi:hypothetical protein